jgi:hypothetical protein
MGDAQGGLQATKRLWADPEKRAAGAADVRQALAHEKAAVAEIEKALAVLDR